MSRRTARALAWTFALTLASIPALLAGLHGPAFLLRLAAIAAFVVVLYGLVKDEIPDPA